MSVVDMTAMLRMLRLMGHWKALEGWRSFPWGSGYECFVNKCPMCTKLATSNCSFLLDVYSWDRGLQRPPPEISSFLPRAVPINTLRFWVANVSRCPLSEWTPTYPSLLAGLSMCLSFLDSLNSPGKGSRTPVAVIEVGDLTLRATIEYMCQLGVTGVRSMRMCWGQCTVRGKDRME